MYAEGNVWTVHHNIKRHGSCCRNVAVSGGSAVHVHVVIKILILKHFD